MSTILEAQRTVPKRSLYTYLRVALLPPRYLSLNHSDLPQGMDLNTRFELAFGILATALAVVAVWLAYKQKRGMYLSFTVRTIAVANNLASTTPNGPTHSLPALLPLHHVPRPELSSGSINFHRTFYMAESHTIDNWTHRWPSTSGVTPHSQEHDGMPCRRIS